MLPESPVQLGQRWLKETIGSGETVVAIAIDEHQLVLLASLVGPTGKVLVAQYSQSQKTSQQALLLTGFVNRVTFFNNVDDLVLSIPKNQPFAGALIVQNDFAVSKTTLTLIQNLRRGGLAIVLPTENQPFDGLGQINLAEFRVVQYSETVSPRQQNQLLAIQRR